MFHGLARRATIAIAAVAVAGLALTGCSSASTTPSGDSSGSAAPADLTKVNFVLGFTAGAWDAGEYVALANGYFKDAGLDVTITEGKGSTSNIQLLEAGTVDIAKIAMSSVVVADEQGGDVKMVSSHMQHSGAGVMAKPELKTVADLNGKSYATSAYDFGGQLLPAFEAQTGITMNVSPVDSSAIPQILVSGQTDAMSGTGWAEVPELQAEGIDFSWFPYADYGVDPLGVGYVTSSGYLSAHEDVVKAFTEAALKGWQYVYDNPDQAAQIVTEQVPGIDLTVAQDTTKVMEGFAHTDASKDMPLGEIAPSDITATVDLMQKYGLITSTVTPDQVYSDILK